LASKPWLKFFPKGVPEKIDYPNVALYDLLGSTAKKYPFSNGIIFKKKKITYYELDSLSDRFAAALIANGVQKADCIALMLPNIPEFVIAFYGVLKAGAFVTAINPLAKQAEASFQLHDSNAKMIVCLDSLYPIVKNVNIDHIIVRNTENLINEKTSVLEETHLHYFDEFLSTKDSKLPIVDINPTEDLAVLQYTGGTTGLPKGAMLTHLNLVSNALMCSKWFGGKEKEDIILAVLPFCHIYGMATSMNFPIYYADTLILLPTTDLTDILNAIQEYHATILCGVPTLYAKILREKDIQKYNLKSLRLCFSGAASLAYDVQRRFMELTGGILVEGYGLTEASSVTHCNPIGRSIDSSKTGSIGIPWSDTEAKIVDPDSGEEVARGLKGELVVRGPQVMKGYWQQPEKTKESIKDGWLHTGDICRMDDDGYFFLIDRKKDVIKSKGYSIYPRELEEIINSHLAVKYSCVIGQPEPLLGEVPKAFVVLHDGMSVSEREIMDFVSDRVAAYKAVVEVEFRKDLPIDSFGKIRRKLLQDS
jgi:long-chain acyl-CoA synthetase